MKLSSAPLLLVLSAWLACVAAPAAAQEVAGATGLDVARAHLAAGRIGEARAALRGVPPSPESLRLSADAALADRDLRAALDAHEQLAGRFKTPAPDLLRSIVVARAAVLRADPDPRVRVDACDVLMAAGEPGDCAAVLNQTAMNADVDAGTRIAAAQALERNGARGATQLVDLVIGTVMVSKPAAAAGALALVPPARSNEPLKTLAFSDNFDARYLAVRALARRRTPDVLPTLRAITADERSGPLRTLAHIGLAGTGEAGSVRFVQEALPSLEGHERLDAALALRLAKVAGAPAAIAELTQGHHELARIDAAEALHASDADAAARTVTAGLASGNPWIKARALEASANLGMPVTPLVRRAMLDPNTTVAVAAARAVVADLTKRQQP